MSILSNSIYHYYTEHFGELPFDKQFHFASRLYLWSDDTLSKKLLRELRPEFTAYGDPERALEQVMREAQATPLHGTKNAGELRRPYFERYPLLKTYVMVLFRLTFLQTVYGIDARSGFTRLFSENDVESLRAKLLEDDAALAVLSTHAINFLYLYDRVLQGKDNTFDPATILRLGETYYDLSDNVQLQLLIYLYTHCIIGESRFYARRLPALHLPIYKRMLGSLEQLIDSHFADVNLDNKFEYLVCCEMVGHTSSLAARIFAEAESSVAETGTFLVDRHNHNPQTDNVSLDKSEHRNVLFIMANRQFRPGRNSSL